MSAAAANPRPVDTGRAGWTTSGFLGDFGEGAQFCEEGDDFLVRWGELKTVQLVWQSPMAVDVLLETEVALENGAPEGVKMQSTVLVDMMNRAKQLANPDSPTKLLSNLALQSPLQGLSLFHLAAWKLPKQPGPLMGSTLRYENAATGDDQSRCHVQAGRFTQRIL
jgi:hypothetical protein